MTPTTNSEVTPKQEHWEKNIATPKPAKKMPSKTIVKYLPHTSADSAHHVSALGSRKRKLKLNINLSAKQSPKEAIARTIKAAQSPADLFAKRLH